MCQSEGVRLFVKNFRRGAGNAKLVDHAGIRQNETT